MKDIRLYPIRLTRNSWKIPLFCIHECSENCSHIMVQSPTNGNIFRYSQNPDFRDMKCDKLENIEPAFIKINSFDINNPCGQTGSLCKSDTIVIPPISFKIRIEYPLTRAIDILVNPDNPDGFRLKDIIDIIQKCYLGVYTQEEETSTPITYNFKTVCSVCPSEDLKQHIESTDIQSGDCPICRDTSNNCNISKLRCKHSFHKDCIENWIDSGGKNCPICRTNIFRCTECDGSGYTYFKYNGVVIPRELRGNLLNRNLTNGVYGIYGYDMEDLWLDGLFFDRINQRLNISITS